MLKVLIVDDKPAVCSGLRRMIPWTQLGAELIGECSNGQEALDLALEHRPGLVITDVRMPVMDGLELCKRLQEQLPDTALIILSAFHDFSYAQTAIRYGVTDYVLKPIDRPKIEQLIHKIAQVAQTRQIRELYYALLYDAKLKERWAAGIKSGDMSAIETQFESLFIDYPMVAYDVIKDICSKLLVNWFEACREAGLSWEHAGLITPEQVWTQLGSAKSKEDIRGCLRQWLEGVTEWVSGRKNKRTEVVVELLRDIVRHKYQDPDLTIYSIASELKLSPNYVSVVFRQGTGETISAYLTRLRMEHSRHLLKDPAASIQEIARNVGYTDPHYFAKVFKKTEGLTPSQYRNLTLHPGSASV
ncbi:response regulator [Paenibacillus elgii]